MSARTAVARTAVAVLTAAAFLTPTASAAAAPGQARDGSYEVAPSGSAPVLEDSCGPTDIRAHRDRIDLVVGKPGRLTVAFKSERNCVLDVVLRPLSRDSGIEVSPAPAVRVSTPATFTWTVTGTKPTKDLFVATVYRAGPTFAVRLSDVTVRPSGR